MVITMEAAVTLDKTLCKILSDIVMFLSPWKVCIFRGHQPWKAVPASSVVHLKRLFQQL